MRRRNFLRISTWSLAGLILSDFAPGPDPRKTHRIQMPDRVEVSTENKTYILSKRGPALFEYRDITVELKNEEGSVEIWVQAPASKLEEIRMFWNHQTSKGGRILGDAWERMYGDGKWSGMEPSQKLPWYCVTYDKDHALCFGVKTGGATFCSWQISPQTLQLNLDTRSGGKGVQLQSRRLLGASIVTTQTKGNEEVFATVRRFCQLMCEHPRLPKQPVYGINDWYFAYGNNSAALILETTSMASTLCTNAENRPFSVIDAGWAVKSPLLPKDCCWGDDFAQPNPKFGDMGKLADEITKLGMRPGIWTRPLTARHDDPANLLLPSIPGRDDPKNPLLDPTIEENLERIGGLWKTYREWGYELVKLDYTTYDIFGRWGFQMADGLTAPGWQFHNPTQTNAEIILNLYRTIREAAEDTCLIGCNTISHLSAGIFELNRVGDDTSGKDWNRTRKMGVNSLAFRMVQHKTFYEADGDCVGLTRDIPWELNRQWMQLLAESSAPLFISADPVAVGEEQKKFMKTCFSKASVPQVVGEPLDWLANPLPSQWKLDGKIMNFNWYGKQ